MKKITIVLSLCTAISIAASGCSRDNTTNLTAATAATEAAETAAEETMAEDTVNEAEETIEDGIIAGEPLVIIEDQPVPIYSRPSGGIRTPQASGTVTYSENSVTLDASNSSSGYVMVTYGGSASKIKVQLIKSGSETYTYDLNARSAYEVFPLTLGNGTYTVKVLEQVQGNQYAVKFGKDISVSLKNEYEPFLYPNQYVNFTAGSAVVQKAEELAAPAADTLGVVTNVYNYVVSNFTYDTAKANSVQSGYLPNVDTVMAQKRGICFDYASVMTAMLRSQEIPTKLVIGYTGSVYHAWVNVYIEGQGWVDNVIYFDGHDWKLMDPTFASSGGNDPAVLEHIKNSANYKAKYSY